MMLEDTFDVWGFDDIRLKGHRIGLDDVLDLYHEGKTPEDITTYYPTLTLDVVQNAIAYYLQHRDELDAYLERQHAYAKEQTQLAEEHPSANALRLRRIRQERALTQTQPTQ